MLPLQFFGQNINFALNLFFSLVTFATFWLYFAAWLGQKKLQSSFKWFAFLLISASFLFQAVVIDKEILGDSLFANYPENLALVVRAVGYAVLVFALIREPLQSPPIIPVSLPKPKRTHKLLMPFSLTIVPKVLLPVGAFAVAFLYFRKATDGMEKHLRAVAFAFLSLAVYEVLGLSSLFRETTNITISNLIAPFGPIWALQQVFLLISLVILGRWVWGYLLKRLQSQLFIIFTSTVLVIFLVISIGLTFLLIKNIEKSALDNLETASKVLNYSLDSKKAELSAIAEVFTQNPEISAAVLAKDHNKLNLLVSKSLENKKISSLVITTNAAMVLSRAEDPDSWGDSLSSDALVQKAISGSNQTSIVTKVGNLVPAVYLQSAQPILKDSAVVGTVLVGLAISNNFLDGIKTSTGLDSAIYAANTRTATTILAPDKKSRWVGIKEENSQIKKEVLEKGQTFKGSSSLVNRPFLVVYKPLKNVNNEIVGMIFTGQPEVSILLAAGRSIELVFILAAVLLIISLVPSYLISKYIAYQLS